MSAWRAGLGGIRDRVRQELVARQLADHLARLDGATAAGSDPLREVLDLGCGQATVAVRLARAGYLVTGIDLSDELLSMACRAVETEPPDVRQRVVLEHGDLLRLDRQHHDRFDLVCCHGVLMYLPTLDQGVAAVVGAVRPGGLVSLLTRNRAAIAMRAGMTGSWEEAVRGFEARHYRNRLGLEEVRADEPDEVAQALERCGASRIAWYGVRLFTDHWEGAGRADEVLLPEDIDDWDSLIRAEEQAGRRDPYRSVAALTHTVAVRAH